MEKDVLICFGLFFVAFGSAIIHNVIYGFGVEEPVFFLISVASFVGFFIYLVFLVAKRIMTGRPRELWKLGYLGFAGFLGFFAPKLFSFFALFLLFILKKK